MASVIIRRAWGNDGDALAIQIEADATHPDALDDARAVAIRTYREALVTTLAAEAEDK